MGIPEARQITEPFEDPINGRKVRDGEDHKKKILIVEDEGIVALDIKHSLERLGYSICGIASSGDAAIEKAKATRPNLVLVDVKLQGEMDGIETAAAIKWLYHTPVIFLTAHSDADILERAKAAEPSGFVLKPYDLKELHSTIEIGLHKHEVEQKLHESRRWFAATLGCIRDSVVASDRNGRLNYINASAQQLLGLEKDEGQGDKLSGLLELFDPGTKERLDLTQMAQTGEGYSAARTAIIVTRKSSEVSVELTAAPIRDNEGTYQGSVFVLRDISERIRAEQEKSTLEDQLFQAQKMEAVGQLAGGFAHDFNNLLTAIMGNLSLIHHKCPPDLIDRVKATEQACSRAAGLVSKLLTFTRTTSAPSSNLAIGPVIEEAVAIAKSTFDPRVHLTCSVDDKLPTVKGDPNQIHQMVLNLCINARDALQPKLRLATMSGTSPKEAAVTIRVYKTDKLVRKSFFRAREKKASYVVIEVKDTGIGMSEETRSRMFEPFFTTKNIGEGTGLGLFVVYGIVKKYGGTIDVQSTIDVGTVMSISLPAAEGEASQSSFSSPHVTPKGNETVLIVDDEGLVRDILRAMLEELGYKVIVSKGGEEGFNTFLAHKETIALVISDLSMPDMPGTVFFNKIREVNQSVKLLLSSGYAADAKALRGEPLSYDMLYKPYKLSELAQKVRDTLDGKASTAE